MPTILMDHADTAHNLPEMWVSLFVRFSFSWHCRRRKPPSYDSADDDTQSPAPICASFPNYTSSPFPDGALDNTVAPACNAFPFVHKPNTHDQHRIVVPTGWCCATVSTQKWGKAWEHDLFDAKLTQTAAPTARCTRSAGRRTRQGFALGVGLREHASAPTSSILGSAPRAGCRKPFPKESS